VAKVIGSVIVILAVAGFFAFQSRSSASRSGPKSTRGASINSETAVRLYSQGEQDQWLSGLFGAAYKGFYLDIGAHDGYILSNTEKLDEQGWKGVCVEPLPHNFTLRTCDLHVTVLTNKTGDSVTFKDCTLDGTDGGDGGLSGIQGIGTYSGTNSRDKCVDKQFTTQSTSDFLASTPGIPAVIDYVSLDVEGAEEMVVSTFPFDRHCVRAWTIERPSEAITSILSSHECTTHEKIREDLTYLCPCVGHPDLSPQSL